MGTALHARAWYTCAVELVVSRARKENMHCMSCLQIGGSDEGGYTMHGDTEVVVVRRGGNIGGRFIDSG